MAEPLWLLLDADDTLWENNIFCEEVIAGFTPCVDHSQLTPAEGRTEIDRIEIRNVKKDGYSSEDSTINLVERYDGFRKRPAATRERLHGMSGGTTFARPRVRPTSGWKHSWIRSSSGRA